MPSKISKCAFEYIVDDTDIGPLPASIVDRGAHLHEYKCGADAVVIVTASEPDIDINGHPTGERHDESYGACALHKDTIATPMEYWYEITRVEEVS